MVDETANKTRISLLQRLIVVLPSMALIVLCIVRFGVSDSFFMVRTRVMYWVSLFSGPVATWLEFSYRTTWQDKVFALLAVLVLLPGILSHPLKPRKATAAVTIFCLLVWGFGGLALTYAGV